ncbi:MAG TPA: NTP transferase domain-containing protein [Negativicutes bacterium]|nr:NTP transferase domain-containing protein [Negativicutes bacterium]
MKPKLSAIILAAGLSSRMREFKPLLPLAETTVIEHVADMFLEAGIYDIVVVTGYRAAELTPVLMRRQLRYAENDRYKEGMYSSVQAGVSALSGDAEAFFLLPVDVPLVNQHSIRLLARDFSQYHGDVTYPVFQGQRGHPPLVSAKLIPLILAQSRSDGLRGLLAEQEPSARDVELVDEGVLMDMDTPEDYRKLVERIETVGIPTQAECEAIFSRTETPVDAIEHGRIAASVARALALELNQSGMHLNIRQTEAAALLHDLAKGKRNHARVGGRILQSLGYGPVAASVFRHMDLDFSATDVITETAVVYLADKLIRRDRAVSIEERFAPAFEKYPPGHFLASLIAQRFSTAKAIACEVEKRIGRPLADIISAEGRRVKVNIDAERN